MTTQPKLSSTTFAAIAGLACFGWAFIAWLTVIPNQDMLADALQVQSLLSDPRLVLSFPGQKHAGPVEYPFQLLAELIAPANFYVHTFPRVIFAFLTGFFTAKLFLALFPQAKHWAFLVAIAVGPAIIHGLSGPEGNTVGVWWLVGNYDTSWLLTVIGTLLFIQGTRNKSKWFTPFAGIVIGLGFFAHPNIIILLIPLGTLTVLTVRPGIRSLALLMIGFTLGIVPSLISYIFFTGNNTWDPSRVPFFGPDIYLNSLGLNGIPDYISVVLPYAFGLPTSQFFLTGSVQSIITWILLMAFLLSAIIGWIQALARRVWPAPMFLLATSWVAAAVGIMFFVTFVDTVWFYATSLSVLFWLTVGALPTIVKPHFLAISLTTAILILEATSMLTHNWAYLTNISEKMVKKSNYQNDIRETARQLQESGVDIVYGSYLDVIPIAYGSSFALHPISVRYNRFPMNDQQVSSNYVVAVKNAAAEPWAVEALDHFSTYCPDFNKVTFNGSEFLVSTCLGSLISTYN